MKAEVHPFTPNCGFTLLEIIVTLTVASVLGTVIFLYMNTSLTRSTEPIARIQKTYSLNQIVEQITADYKKLLDTDSNPLATLQGRIAGNTYGQYTQQTAFITFSGPVSGLYSEITNSGDRILKVAITLNNQTITVLFTK